MNKETEKLEVKKPVILYDYDKDKFKWVKFKDNRPKMKIRKILGELARALAQSKRQSYPHFRAALIIGYNEGGIQSMITKYKELSNTYS